ncbi:MAG: hypothetical protein JXX29_01520 [Deltaproteobacteria bacterium]|nr:hypothetical protein [Deltaproteobacteria bacterium]MBN2670318.1 hypothetical protein [Deltaproteobacteria bacterium]
MLRYKHFVGGCITGAILIVALGCTDGVMNVGAALMGDSESDRNVAESTDIDGSDSVATDTEIGTDSDYGNIVCDDGGVGYADHCWYLGEAGDNCIEVCEVHGGYSDATSFVTGTPSEGGDWEECRNIFRRMGFDGEVGAASRLSLSSEGLGCHIWNDGLWWLIHPDVNPEAAYSVAERVCACQR